MPVLLPAEGLWFPPLTYASPEGLLAVGGDLSPQRLLLAYAHGIFPWYDAESPILWWSPDPRCILPLEALRVPRRLARRLRQEPFDVTRDTAFAQVMERCASSPRPGQNGTWLLPEMRAAYGRLHQMGFAHSVEVWRNGNLVGGLYGVALGRAFFGESMFHLEADASKAALVRLVGWLREWGFLLLDCQQETPHMTRLGATMVPRQRFMALLQRALERRDYASSSCINGSWASKS